MNRVLEQHRGPTIDEFRVWFDLDKGYARDINRWIMFAMQKQVQRLEIHLSGFRSFDPQRSIRYTFLYQLLLRLQTRGSFKSLKDLTLRQVNVSWEVVDYFLANCPNLERLFVGQSNHLEKLSVVGSSLPLKHLGVYFCSLLKSINICDTNLVSFEYAGHRTRLLVNNAPLLVDVSISERTHSNLMLRQLSSCFSQLQILTLSKANVQVSVYNDAVFVLLLSIYYAVMQFTIVMVFFFFFFFQDKIKLRLFTGLKNLKKLVLEIGAQDDESFLLFTPLVEACPYLQIFVFKVRVFPVMR
jgi:hypothetical protein